MLDFYIERLAPALVDDTLAFLEQHVEDHVIEAAWAGMGLMGVPDKPGDSLEIRGALAKHLLAGELEGLLAYVDGQPAALCITLSPSPPPSPRRSGPGSAEPGEGAAQAGVVAALLVGSAFAGLGLARRLLDAACARFSAEGRSFVEGYPPKARSAAVTSDTRSLFLGAGFVQVGERGERVVVRKPLRLMPRARRVG